MQSILFTSDECIKIRNGIKNSLHGGKENKRYKKYEEFLILDEEILNMILEKVKIYGIKNIKEGRVLRYSEGCFFKIHSDIHINAPHRYKTLIIQLSDENEYTGGKFIFGEEVLSKKIGSTTIFDSNTLHGLEIVESGIRYSFIMWLERENFGITKSIL